MLLWNFKRPKALALDWPLIDSPVPVAFILLTYAYFVLKCGKLLMRNRQPYNVKNILLVYNAVQIVFNSIMFWISLKNIIITPVYDISCMEGLPADHPKKFIEQCTFYAYLINKILDLADTVFFVLRKSYKQITLLHFYHHMLMVAASYGNLRFYGSGGHVAITGTLNTFVHIIMYLYYLLSALNQDMRKSLWWKRYITIIQMLQFVIIVLHSVYVLVFSKDCAYPSLGVWFALIQAAVMLVLFANFYIKTYMKPQKVKSTTQAKAELNVKEE